MSKEETMEKDMAAISFSSISPAAANATMSAAAVGVAVDATSASAASMTYANPAICRYFLRGICRFGNMCRFSHDLSADAAANDDDDDAAAAAANGTVDNDNTATAAAVDEPQPQPSTSSAAAPPRRDWANAPVFVPSGQKYLQQADEAAAADFAADAAAAPNSNNKSWADVVGGGSGGVSRRVGVISHSAASPPGSIDAVCPYDAPCPYGGSHNYCAYAQHPELCHMCDQYCLHPSDQAQRRRHNRECLQAHEQAMELSFAIARSKDKMCGICFDTILEKAGREKRFGILPNCAHIFCLECIRTWRQATQFDHKITRSCPECRVSSDFVCPSAFWVDTKEEKDKLLNDYRAALGVKDCKYFKKGDGKCPFGNKCFYKHALPNGELVDVGCPKRARKLHRSTNEIIDMFDIYLWEFVDRRDYHWLDLLSSASDDSEDSEWSEDE